MQTNIHKIAVNYPSAPKIYRYIIYSIVALMLGSVLYHGGTVILTGTSPPVELIIYGFSTQEECFRQRIFPAFEIAWEAGTGRELIIDGVFGPSGTLANQIVLGAPADVGIFSNAQHVSWLQVGKKIESSSEAEDIGSTPMVIITRQGNPMEIRDYADLSQPNLQMVHAEPGRSGAGDWAVLAEYGSAYLKSGDPMAGETQLRSIWNNVTILGSSARSTLSLFELGVGDATVTYEQDALLALDRGVPLEIIYPPSTIVADHMAVIIDDNVSLSEREAAKDLLHFLLSDTGQEMLAQCHMRPPQDNQAASPMIFKPFTIDDLGGWTAAYHHLIEGVWRDFMDLQLANDPLPRLINGSD